MLHLGITQVMFGVPFIAHRTCYIGGLEMGVK